MPVTGLKKPPMKVLVQQPTTGLFYQGSQRWVADPDLAYEFPDTLQAFDFCANHTLIDAQIFLCTASPAGVRQDAAAPQPEAF